MAGLSVGGLASGLDTNSIVAQLTAIEQAKVTREIQKKTDAENTLSKFKELQTRLGTLAQKAAALETPEKFNVFKASSNYEDYATVSGKEGATAGSYEVVVNKLATSQKVTSKSISAINKSMLEEVGMTGEATIKLSLSAAAQKADPTKKDVEIKINSSDTLKDIVNKINAAEGAGVTASMMTLANGDNRLVLTAVDTGTKGFTISEDFAGGSNTHILETLGILKADSQTATSSNALITIKGNAATGSNTFEDLSLNSTFDEKSIHEGTQSKNNIKDGDVIGIYLPTENGSGGAGWVTFDLYDDNPDYDPVTNPDVPERIAKTIGKVLEDINTALGGANADFTAYLNSSGEIALIGNLNGDQNFDNKPNPGGTPLSEVKIQIGTLKEPIPPSTTIDLTDTDIFSEVKKDMGSLSSRDTFANVDTQGENAFYTIGGMAVSSQSNRDETTISGTVFTLKKVSQGMEPIKLSLSLDKDAIMNNITAFIEEYNALLKFIDENAKASIKEEKDEITGIKKSTRVTGAFTGDAGISSMREQLRQIMTSTINELANKGTDTDKNKGYTEFSSLSRLGITTQKDGTIGIERDKLSKALTTDFEGVRRLFTANWFSDDPSVSVGRFTKDAKTGVYTIGSGGVTINGDIVASTSWGNILTYKGISFETSSSTPDGTKVTFIRGLASMFTNWVETAKTNKVDENTGRIIDGYYKASEKNYQERIDSIQKRVDQLQVRVDNYNKRLVAQFNALERNMSNLQSQTANMLSALGTK